MDVAGALERARARVYQAPLAFVTTREPVQNFGLVCVHIGPIWQGGTDVQTHKNSTKD